MDKRIRNLKINFVKISSLQDTVDIMINVNLHMVLKSWDKANVLISSTKLNNVNHTLLKVAVNMDSDVISYIEKSNHQLKKDLNKNSSYKTFLMLLFNKAIYLKFYKNSEEFYKWLPKYCRISIFLCKNKLIDNLRLIKNTFIIIWSNIILIPIFFVFLLIHCIVNIELY